MCAVSTTRRARFGGPVCVQDSLYALEPHGPFDPYTIKFVVPATSVPEIANGHTDLDSPEHEYGESKWCTARAQRVERGGPCVVHRHVGMRRALMVQWNAVDFGLYLKNTIDKVAAARAAALAPLANPSELFSSSHTPGRSQCGHRERVVPVLRSQSRVRAARLHVQSLHVLMCWSLLREQRDAQ